MIEIGNRCDFTITLTIVDKDNVVIPYEQVDWEVWYYTSTHFILKAYSKNGVLSDNVEVIGNDLVISVNNFEWGVKGDVYRRAFVSYADAKFIDGRADICSTPEKVTTFKIV